MSQIILILNRQLHSLVVSVTLALVLVGGLLFLSACGSQASADPVDDLLAPYRGSLKEKFAGDLELAGAAPRYDITALLDSEKKQLQGTAEIFVPNVSGEPWGEIVFRLYPMLSQYGGNMVIQSALVNGKPASFRYLEGNTAVQVDLLKPLLSGQDATLSLAWRLDYPQWTDSSENYILFGQSQQMLSLPLFYPALAVYQPGTATDIGGWWLDEGTQRGDSLYSVATLFAVTLTLPSQLVPVTSGTLIGSTPSPENVTEYRYVAAPVREFMLHLSPVFQSLSAEAYGTTVTSYYLPGQEAQAQAALNFAVASIRIYSDHFGEYPFRDYRVAPAPINYRGMEYPQLSLLGGELYGRMRQNLEMLVAHETAHQWWYQIVHNDPVNEPWLDEALAEYSMKIYMESQRGEDDAAVLVVSRWETPLEGLAAKGQDTLVNQPVGDFLNGTQYETVVYGKGALFYEQVNETVGTRRFDRFLQNYLKTHRYGIVDTALWLNVLRDLPDPALVTLFEKWVALPDPAKATPTALPAETSAETSAESP